MSSRTLTPIASTTSEANGGTHYHIGSKLEIYSKSAKEWMEGEVVRIIHDNEGPWLEVKYSFDGKFRTKEIPTDHKHIRRPRDDFDLDPIHIDPDHDPMIDANPNDISWNPSNKPPLSLDSNIRNKWTIASQVEVYSVISKQWIHGFVKRIIIDEEGEWLEIEYSIHGETRMKQVQRDAVHNIRPIDVIQRLERSIPRHIKTEGAKYRNRNKENIIVTNTRHEYYVPTLEDEITRIQKEKKDWRPTLYDVYMYDGIESKINKRPNSKIKFKTAETRTQFAQYIQQRMAMNHKSIEFEPKSKIVDSILTFHHYTIAVSHIIKNYHIFPRFKLSVVFIINKRYSMHLLHKIEAKQILDQYKINYSHARLMGRDLNESIQSIWNLMHEYKEKSMDTTHSKQMILLFKLNANTHESNRCTLFIYNNDGLGALDAKSRVIHKRSFHYVSNKRIHSTHDALSLPIQYVNSNHHYFKHDPAKPNTKATILPYIPDDHWSFFLLKFEYINKKHVKCYWKMDGKILRFFPEHMESVWPKYFVMTSHDTNRLIYHHKYRHQFGVGLYDKSFCTMYYAITKKRFLSTHYYREYHLENRLSLQSLEITMDKSHKKQLEAECKYFQRIMGDKCHIDDSNKTHECNAINRLVFMLQKHSNNELEELCYILKKCKLHNMNSIEKDTHHLIHRHSTDFKEIFTHMFQHMMKAQQVMECTPKLACWPLRRRTRSIFRVKQDVEWPPLDTIKDTKESAIQPNVYDLSQALSMSDEEKELQVDNHLQIKTMRRILDNLHCEIFHRDPDKNFRQMWVDKSSIGRLQNATLADFERIILDNASTLWQLYEDLKEEGISETELADMKQFIADHGYETDNIRMIEDVENEDTNDIYTYLDNSALNAQKYRNIVKCHLNDYYLHTAAIFRKYKIREEIFMNAERKDIKDLLLHEKMEIDRNTFDTIYREIRNQTLQEGNNNEKEEEEESSDNNNNNNNIVYSADSSDEWLSREDAPRFKSIRDEFILNQFSPISRSDYIDTEIECQLLHENTDKNIDIMCREELIALKVFTDYSHLQTAFSMAYYDDDTVDKARKREFYRWSLILQQAMHYAARNSEDGNKLWRGLQGLIHFDSFEPMAQQPTSFSLSRDKASEFCGDRGILLESHRIIGIALKWLSNFEHEDEWWCFKIPFKLDRIYVRCRDVKERVNYLRYALQNMSDAVPNDGDIHTFDFCNGGDIKPYVIDLLQFDCKEPEILKPTKYNDLSLLQRLFFELEQYWIVSPIWNFSADDIESCTVFQRQYLLQNHIFPAMDEECKSYEYREQIMAYMAQREEDTISIDSALCHDIVRYINKTDGATFIRIVNESIETYNNESAAQNNNNNNNRISAKQKEMIVHYFNSHQWNHAQFNSENRLTVINVFKQTAGLRGNQSKHLYKYIKSKTNPTDAHALQLAVVELDDFYHAMIRYKAIKHCTTAQLIYILERHLLPQMNSTHRHSTVHKYHQAIVEYINKRQLNGETFMCRDEGTFSQRITTYIRECNPSGVVQRNDSNKSVLSNASEPPNNAKPEKPPQATQNHKAFIKMLKRSIQEHQAKFYAPKKKKLYHLDKKKIVNYFKDCDYTFEDFKCTKSVRFISNILGNKKTLNIKAISAKKLYAILEKHSAEGENMAAAAENGGDASEDSINNRQNNHHLNFSDLYLAMRAWESHTMMKRVHTFIDFQLGKEEEERRNAFDLLIGEFELIIKEDQEPAFQMNLDEKQQRLLDEYPPTIKLLAITNSRNGRKKVIKSATLVFRIDISEILDFDEEECCLQYRITLEYNEYELVSRVKSITISAQDINALKSVYDISGAATPLSSTVHHSKSHSPFHTSKNIYTMPSPMSRKMMLQSKKKDRDAKVRFNIPPHKDANFKGRSKRFDS